VLIDEFELHGLPSGVARVGAVGALLAFDVPPPTSNSASLFRLPDLHLR
jgi:hypothetical protein